MSNITDQKLFHLPSTFRRYLPNFFILVSFNSNSYELAKAKEGGIHFILSNNGNYDFDVNYKKKKKLLPKIHMNSDLVSF